MRIDLVAIKKKITDGSKENLTINKEIINSSNKLLNFRRRSDSVLLLQIAIRFIKNKLCVILQSKKIHGTSFAINSVSNRIVELQSVIYNSLTPSKQQESSSLNLSPRIASKICDKDNQVKKSNDLGFVKNQPGDHIKHTSHIASHIIEIQNQSTYNIKENDDEGWIEVNSKRKKMTNFSKPM